MSTNTNANQSGGKVYVVDDELAVRRSLRWLLESAGMEVEAYENGDEFLAHYDGDAPACLVLDLMMPGKTGLELQQDLAERGMELPIIFLTGQGKVPDAVKALKQGAFEFLEKPFSDDVLLDRIRAALEHDHARQAERADKAASVARISGLTRREREVVARVASGLPNKVIAMELGLSPRTVEVYRAQAMRKTGAKSLAELVQLVVKTGSPAPVS
jgi:FixJ family two-component response regulator